MSLFSTWALRLFGVSGIIGAILFIIGDLLYNHIPGSTKSPTEKMSLQPESRLLTAGTLGMIGCWLYTLAAAQLYLAFQPAGGTFAFILLLAFGAVMICYGIAHTAYFSIASGAQAAVRLGSDAETGGKLGKAFFQRLTYVTYIPVVVASVMMFYGIITVQSLYPRWMVILLPVVIYLLKTPVVRILRGRFRELVNDSYDNITLFVFYGISTVVLWNTVI